MVVVEEEVAVVGAKILCEKDGMRAESCATLLQQLFTVVTLLFDARLLIISHPLFHLFL